MRVHVVNGGDGCRIHVDETGNPDGRPILFIHGFSQCRLAWSKQMRSDDLAVDHRLVAMDSRGHGLSDKPRDAYSNSRLWAEDVHAVITTLGLERPILVGWSYGGVTVCDYVAAYGEDTLAAINLVAAVTWLGTPRTLAVCSSEFLALTQGFLSNDAETSVRALDDFVRLSLPGAAPPEDHYLVLGYNAVVTPYVRRGLFSRVLDHADLLESLRLPVLISHGGKDGVISASAAEYHAKAIPHAKLSLYPEAGHLPFWEDPARFNRDLRDLAG